jgi:mono/diheme cytochrome c family protein
VSFRNLIIIVAVVAACGGKSNPPAPPPEPAKPEPAPPVAEKPPEPEKPAEPVPAEKPAPPKEPEPDAFIKLAKDEKIKIMKTKVQPAMAKAFKAVDGKAFAKFNCKTCHGKGAADETFKMPNPDLPPLDFAAIQAGNLDAKAKKMLDFMEKKVKPDVAKILGLPEFDPAHPEAGGFGCLACHTMKK